MQQAKNLFSHQLKINVVNPEGKVRAHHVDQTAWFRGRLVSGPGADSSVVRAHRTEAGLHGTIHVDGELFRFEPLNRSDARHARSPAEFNHVIYAHRHTRSHKLSQSTCGYTEDDFGDHAHGHDHHDHHSRKRRKASTVQYGNSSAVVGTVCQMHLVADHHFFNYKGSVIKATDSMIEFLDDVNSKYITAALDATIADPALPDLHMYAHRLQFSVTTITVFETAADIKNTDGSIRMKYPWKYSNGGSNTDSASEFLNGLTFLNGAKSGPVSELVEQNDPYICLTHAFTHQDFSGGVLGLAWKGTVCRATMATGITTTINYGDEPVYTQNMLVVAHEMGHNVGMPHDEAGCEDYCETSLNNPSVGKCAATDNGKLAQFVGDAVGGKYAMWPVSVDGEESNNYMFSACSRFMTVKTMIAGGGDSCLTVPQDAVCGNGMVEPGEECDCAVSGGGEMTEASDGWATDKEYCQESAANTHQDSCCLPNCMLDKGAGRPDGPAQCSPKKGECCSDKAGSKCQLTGFGLSQIDPVTLQPTAQALIDEKDNLDSFECRSNQECIGAVYCTQEPEYVGACPYDSLNQAGEDKQDEVKKFWKSESTLCKAKSKTCQKGECIGDLCIAYQYTNPITNQLVIPEGCTDPLLPCTIACDMYGNGSCIASTLLNDSGFDMTWVPTNMPKEGAIKAPGGLCNGGKGQCDLFGSCLLPDSRSPTDILAELFDIDLSAWVWINWMWVLTFQGTIFGIAFAMRCGKNKADKTKDFVKNRLRGDEFSKTIKRRAFNSTRRGKGDKKKKKKSNMTLRNMAVLEAEGENLRRTSEIFGGEKRKDLAFHRLRVLFPFAKEEIIKAIIPLCPHEEAAVARLLVLGHAMWEVTDYKLLNYQAKKNKKMGNVKRLKDRSVRYPQGRGGGGGGGGGRGGGGRGGGGGNRSRNGGQRPSNR